MIFSFFNIFALLFLIILIVYIIIKYNTIIKYSFAIKKAKNDIEVFMQQRFDMIPNLVELVKGYTDYESDTLQEVIGLRSGYMNSQTIDQKSASDTMLTNSLKHIFALSEAYPDLKADASFQNLHDELVSMEDKIAAARRYFNDTTQEFNAYISLFPNSVIAGIFGITQEIPFVITNDDAKEPVLVSFKR